MAGFKYALPTKALPRKLVLVLLLETVIVTTILLLAVHPTWRTEQWVMMNENHLIWDLGLFRNYASANCDALNMPQFHAICMLIFKNTSGTYSNIQQFLCSLNSAPLKIEPQFEAAARAFHASCGDAQSIASVMLTCFLLMVFCAFFGSLVFVSLLRLAYKKFQAPYRRWYWIALLSQIAICGILLAVLLFCWFRLDSPLPGIFHYVPRDELTPIQKIIGGSSFGIGFYSGWILLIVNTSIIALIIAWIPVVPIGTLMTKKQPRGEARPKRRKDVFWAYMPEVFQPDIYVAEMGPPELIGYAPGSSVTTVTHTGGGIDPTTGLGIPDEMTYSFVH